jgi:hypothetical protein
MDIGKQLYFLLEEELRSHRYKGFLSPSFGMVENLGIDDLSPWDTLYIILASLMEDWRYCIYFM